jgi:hypothetical protein
MPNFDPIFPQDWYQTCSDNIKLSDSLVEIRGLYRSLTENLLLSSSKILSPIKILTNDIKINDTKKISISKALLDSIKVTDKLPLDRYLTYSENIKLSDDVKLCKAKLLSENIIVNSEIIKSIDKVLLDNIVINESINHIEIQFEEVIILRENCNSGLTKTFSDSLKLNDGDITNILEKTLTDNLKLSSSKTLDIIRNISDNLKLSDDLTTNSSFKSRTFSETIRLDSNPLGNPDETNVYVWDDVTSDWIEIEGIEYFKIEKRLNQMSKFNITMPQIEATQKLYVKEFAKVLMMSNQVLILKGRIQKVTYQTTSSCEVEGFGMESVILDKEYQNATISPTDPDRVQYTNYSAQTIAKQLLSTNADGVAPWIMEPRTYGLFVTDYGDISIRYEFANTLTALGNLAGAINYDWWVDQTPLTFATDYFNIASIKGNQTNPALDVNRQFTITGANVNAEGTDYQKDITNVANFVKCYDEQTEVLTKNGFKFFKDVTLNDEIATLNPETDELEYHKPLAKQEYDYNGKMHHYKNMNVDLLVTPDHSLYCKKIWDKKFKRIESKEVFNKWLNFKKDCKWVGKSEEYFTLPKIEHTWHCGKGKGHDKTEIYAEKQIPIKLWLQFMGWFLSEGNLHNNIRAGYKIRITQNYPNLDKIIELIKQMGYNPFICKNPDRIEFYDKQLYLYLKQFGKAKDKFIPEFIKNLSTEQINLFLNILFDGDGCHNKKEEMTCYYSISKRLIEDVSELLLKTLRGFKFGFKNGCFSLSINNHNLKCYMNKKSQIKENYSGQVYDLTVPNHIMFIRRNNTCIWSGNCQGYGDGINQVYTTTYNASPIWTTLSANITNSDVVIPLLDVTGFPAAGTIRIAEEIITYTGIAGSTLTGCTRGTSGTTALLHRSGCYLEKYVVYTSPAIGSSIADYGLMQLTETFRDVIDLSTLELIASHELIDRMTPIERINIIPADPITVSETIETGDLVSVVDDESGLNSDYRIITIIYEFNYGSLSMTLEASNKSLTFIEQMQKEREKNQALQKYMQGSTNVYVANNSENCDTNFGCVVRTYIPTEAIAINHVKVSYIVSQYRSYQSVTGAGSAHVHSLSGITTTVQSQNHSHVMGSLTFGTNYTGNATPDTSHTHEMGNHSHTQGTFSNSGTSTTTTLAHSHTYDKFVSYSSYVGGMVGSPDTIPMDVRHSHSMIFSDYTQAATTGSGSNSHSHDISGYATNAESSHTHGITSGISSGVNTLSKMNILIDGVDRTAAIEIQIGHVLSLVSEDEIDVTQWITTVGAWHTINFEPVGTCYISGELWNQIFIQSI